MLRGFLDVDIEKVAAQAHFAHAHFFRGRFRRRGRRSLAGLQSRGVLDDVFRFDHRLPARAQLLDPAGKRAARFGDQLEEAGRRRLLHLEPAIHHLLDLPGDFAQVAEADHAAAALKGMEAAPDGGQRFDVIGRAAAKRQRAVDSAEHVARFLEEDRQQLLVSRRLDGRRRLRSEVEALVGERRRGAFFVAAKEQHDRFFRGLAPREAGLEEHAEAGETVGARLRLSRGRRAAGDQRLADRQHFGGTFEAQHEKRAVDLPQVRGERRQRVALGRIACVSIEHLLDVLQVGDDFLRDLRAHLQEADALAEIGAQSRRRLARGSTLRRVEQPAAHDDDLLLEIRRWGGEVVDHAFHQQERRSHLDHHELLLARMRIGQLGGDERDGVEQLHQMLVAELGGLGLEGADELAEAQHALWLAGNVLQPGALQRDKPRARIFERRLQPVEVELHDAALVGGKQRLDLVELLHLPDARRGTPRLAHGIEQVAQQRIVDRLRAPGKVAHVEVEPIEQHLRVVQPFAFRRLGEPIGERERDPP